MKPFIQPPIDILRALAYVGLGRYELIVVVQILEQAYGVAKAPSVVVSQSATGKRYGVARQNIHNAIERLKDNRIILRAGDGWAMNENVSEWRIDDPKERREGLMKLMESADAVMPTHDACNAHALQDSPERNAQALQDPEICNAHTLQDESACNAETLQPSCQDITNVMPTHYSPIYEVREESYTSSPGEVWEPTSDRDLQAWVLGLVEDPSGYEGSGLAVLLQYGVRWAYHALRLAFLADHAKRKKQYAERILQRWLREKNEAVAAGLKPKDRPWEDDPDGPGAATPAPPEPVFTEDEIREYREQMARDAEHFEKERCA